MADDTTEKKPSRAARKLWERKRYDNYFQRLGEFVHCFTMAEHAVSACLHHHAKVSTDVHRAVFSGVRMKEGISFLRRLADVGEIDPREWQQLKPLLDQLTIINGVRNKLLHQGADGIEEDDEPFISNLRTALTWEKLEEFPVTVGHLRDMVFDLNTVFFAISHRHSGDGWGYRRRDRPRLEKRSNEPWWYKSPEPTRIHRPHPDEFAKLRLQPKAYRRKSRSSRP